MESYGYTPERLPRYGRLEDYSSIVIGRPKAAIIEAVGRFHYLSARQLASLLFSRGSLTYVQAHCAELYQAGYLQRVYLPRRQPGGSPLAIYALDRRGYDWLSLRGNARGLRFRRTEEAQREELFLAHTLASTDVLILAQQLARDDERVTVAQMLTERELKRRPVRVKRGNGETSVMPDGWLDLRVGENQQMCLAIELDRGTVERERFQQKIRAYVAYAQGPYQKAFGTQSLTVLFITTAGEGRLARMLEWTASELESAKAESFADLFRFASFDPGTAEPKDVFYSPIWRIPGSGSRSGTGTSTSTGPDTREPVALIARAGGQS